MFLTCNWWRRNESPGDQVAARVFTKTLNVRLTFCGRGAGGGSRSATTATPGLPRRPVPLTCSFNWHGISWCSESGIYDLDIHRSPCNGRTFQQGCCNSAQCRFHVHLTPLSASRFHLCFQSSCASHIENKAQDNRLICGCQSRFGAGAEVFVRYQPK